MRLFNTSYNVCGQGKPVVFLHGWGSNKESFNGIVNTLSQFYQCISFDFWGFGKSEKPDSAWSIDDYANAVENFLNELKIKSCYVVAHSFGGRVAIKLCTRTSCVKKLVLVDSAGLKPRQSLRTKIKIWQYKRLKKKVEQKKIGSEVLQKFGSVDYKNASPNLKEIFLKVVNQDLTNDAKLIKTETKIIYGKHDKDTPVYMAKKFHKIIKNSSLTLLDAGHFCFVDKPKQFCAECLKFWGDYV